MNQIQPFLGRPQNRLFTTSQNPILRMPSQTANGQFDMNAVMQGLQTRYPGASFKDLQSTGQRQVAKAQNGFGGIFMDEQPPPQEQPQGQGSVIPINGAQEAQMRARLRKATQPRRAVF